MRVQCMLYTRQYDIFNARHVSVIARFFYFSEIKFEFIPRSTYIDELHYTGFSKYKRIICAYSADDPGCGHIYIIISQIVRAM